MPKNVNGRGQTVVSPSVMPPAQLTPLSARPPVEPLPGPSTAPPALRTLDKHAGFVAGRKVTSLPTDKRLEWLETVVVDLSSRLELAESLIEDLERETAELRELGLPKAKSARHALAEETILIGQFLQQHTPLKFGVASIADNLDLTGDQVSNALHSLTKRGVSRSEGGAGKTRSYWVEDGVEVNFS